MKEYLDILKKKMRKDGVDSSSIKNIQPKYMDNPNKKQQVKCHDLVLIKNNKESSKPSNLETVLEKQKIALSGDGREGILMKSILEEEGYEKAEFDQQVEERFQNML